MTLNFELKSGLKIEGCWFTQMFLSELIRYQHLQVLCKFLKSFTMPNLRKLEITIDFNVQLWIIFVVWFTLSETSWWMSLKPSQMFLKYYFAAKQMLLTFTTVSCCKEVPTKVQLRRVDALDFATTKVQGPLDKTRGDICFKIFLNSHRPSVRIFFTHNLCIHFHFYYDCLWIAFC